MYQIIKQILRTGIKTETPPQPDDALRVEVQNLQEQILRHVGSALAIRHVDAVGDCGCDGGIFGESYASCGKISNVIPVDVAVPGCPPTPTALLQGILT